MNHLIKSIQNEKNISNTAYYFYFNSQRTKHIKSFFYELTYKPNKDSVKLEKEMMVLDIDENRSVYQAYDHVMLDLILNTMEMKAVKSGIIPDMNTMPQGKPIKFSHQIFKTYPIKEILYKDQMLIDSYTYRETPNILWKISNETQKIGTYITQKATADFGGRKWNAWFASEIPFQDGPYKFFGLPSLIIKIEDEEKKYSWELKGNRKINNQKDAYYTQKKSFKIQKNYLKKSFRKNMKLI
ncbi:GLPGLI family protein [Chryseobacterium sp. H1D6B]|uniref:GLPGLI family protein n=1 Tax=Chryseobacterium sp. H1D6B TaxID=2940588 RepID=UPI0015C7BC4D|nr:GLPGLI family protein [Chryseobacterium sp. H1D6B]MDH6251747.1 GLPGLI family protein [Chryseobacterium sp. H1D6B]